MRRICGLITARTLGYWIDRGIVSPSAARRSRRRGRQNFYFDFEAVLRVKLVKGLRDSGISLQKIRIALDALADMDDDARRAAWLVTDGRDLYCTTDTPDLLKTLTGKGSSMQQFVFSFVAIQEAREATDHALRSVRPVKLRPDAHTIIPWRRTGTG